MIRFPSLFVSHGAPVLALEPGATGAFLAELGRSLPKPTAILMVSAHWETTAPAVSSAAHPDTIHDFSGFPEALYRLRYPAPGAPAVAQRVRAVLNSAGIRAGVDDRRGLDHGAWVPLMLMYPAADIPVMQLAIVSGLPSVEATNLHLHIGEALRELRDEGVLILGSGSVTHNLRALAFHEPAAPVLPWVSEFNDWLARQLDAGDRDALVNYRQRAPHAVRNHPTEEHLLPLMVAAGAAFDGEPVQRLHAAYRYGGLGMDAWQFGA